MIYFLSFPQSLSGNPDFLWFSYVFVPYPDTDGYDIKNIDSLIQAFMV
jgi:hypothetical protein